jgi:hypothetical protein
LFTAHLYPETQVVGPVYPIPPHWFHYRAVSTISLSTSQIGGLTASAGLPVGVGVTGLADDFDGTSVLDALVDVGWAVDLVAAADDVGLPTTDDDLLPPGLPEPARARILAAACSAIATM